MRTGTRAAALAVIVVSAACRPAHESGAPAVDSVAAPPPISWTGTFAFASSAGTELLTLGGDSVEATDAGSDLRWAVCRGAKRVRVAHVRTQEEDAGSSGRQTAGNFARTAGEVYAGDGRDLEPNGTCFLTADSVLAASVAPYTAVPKPVDCTNLQSYAISARNGRKVESCVEIGRLGEGNSVIATQLSVRDSTALASLVLFRYASPADRDAGRPARILFFDQLAAYRGPGEDIWRVDDGGRFDPSAFEILFAGQLRGTVFLALTWAGAEGESDNFLVADSLDAFRVAKSAYRYWSP
jgi:hypothetical protein